MHSKLAAAVQASANKKMDGRVDFDDMFLDDSFQYTEARNTTKATVSNMEHNIRRTKSSKSQTSVTKANDDDESTVLHRNKKSKRKKKSRSIMKNLIGSGSFDVDHNSFDLDDKIQEDEPVSRMNPFAAEVLSSTVVDLDDQAEGTGTSSSLASPLRLKKSRSPGKRKSKEKVAKETGKRLDMDGGSMLTTVSELDEEDNVVMPIGSAGGGGSVSHSVQQIVHPKIPLPQNETATTSTNKTRTKFSRGAVATLAGTEQTSKKLVDLDDQQASRQLVNLDDHPLNMETKESSSPVELQPSTPSNTRVDLDHVQEFVTSGAFVYGNSRNGIQNAKMLHDVPLGQPESPLSLQVKKLTKGKIGVIPPIPQIFRRRLAIMACSVIFCIMTVLIVVFNLNSSSSEEFSSCELCPKGQTVKFPDIVFEDNATTVTLMYGFNCMEVESMAIDGIFNETECAAVQEQTRNVCGCHLPPKPTSSPTVSPAPTPFPTSTHSPTISPAPTTHPTTSPTKSPTSFPTLSPTEAAPVTSAPTPDTEAPVLYTFAPVPPSPPTTKSRNHDRFNYRKTDSLSSHTDYGPRDWGNVRCPDETSCLGWPDTWEYANGWDVDSNHCRWCPKGSNRCGRHHQSPIDLRRSFAVPGTKHFNECLDVHLMNFHDSTCTVQKLREKRAFAVDRHALRIHQPVKWVDHRSRFYLDCRNDNFGGMRFGRIDFSFGFSNWWYLSHTDFHLPSEHTQDGKRYDAEIQMYHFYSVDAEVAGVNNEMGTVAVFLEAYDDAPDYGLLNEIICGWREEEERVRRECGMGSVATPYPGCPDYTGGANRKHRRTSEFPKRSQSVNDILIQNHMNAFTNTSFEPLVISLDEEEHNDVHEEETLQQHSSTEDENETTHTFDVSEDGRRRMFLNQSTSWNNYFPLVDVGTEYYYRYSGTQTVPPCYGQFYPGEENRRQTNHWRVMKDPIRVSRRQITEMHRLVRERIAPSDDSVAACRPDTAAEVDRKTGQVNTARPLQETHEAHFSVFCECPDWRSASETDKSWCQKSHDERFTQHPYNFETNGF